MAPKNDDAVHATLKFVFRLTAKRKWAKRALRILLEDDAAPTWRSARGGASMQVRSTRESREAVSQTVRFGLQRRPGVYLDHDDVRKLEVALRGVRQSYDRNAPVSFETAERIRPFQRLTRTVSDGAAAHTLLEPFSEAYEGRVTDFRSAQEAHQDYKASHE